MIRSLSELPRPSEAAPAAAEIVVETLPIVPRRPVVLIVDREARIRAVLGVMLGRHGLTVLRAADSAEALAVCRERHGKVDVVLLDTARSGHRDVELVEALQSVDSRVRFCLMGGSGLGCGEVNLAGRIVSRVPRSLGIDDLVRSLWLLVAGAAPDLELPGDSADEATARTNEERRESARRSCELAPRCYPLSAPTGERWRAELCDISASGARLVLDRPVEAGTLLVLELPATSEAPPRRFVARAIRVALMSEGRWTLGCVFARRLSDARLEALLREQPGDTRRREN
jgi:DNA-binding NarL/FixJ family response regulator